MGTTWSLPTSQIRRPVRADRERPADPEGTHLPRRVPVDDNQPMQIAIVGLAASGKTTVFNTLTRGHAETGGFGGIQLNVGVVKVPD